MADSTLEILVKLGVVGEEDVRAAQELLAETVAEQNKAMDVLVVRQADVEAATTKTAAATENATKKFAANRKEIRDVTNELGHVAGVEGVGKLAMGGVSVAAFGAVQSLEFLKDTWNEVQKSIKGPIEVQTLPEAPAHISSIATAWNEYAVARAKVNSAANSPESQESATERRLDNELKLIKQVQSAEKEKALADLELHKAEMTPEAYEAARQNIGNIFGDVSTKAEQQNRKQKIQAKKDEADNLEIDAHTKTKQAMAIHVAPENVVKANQKVLDANAAKGEEAKKELKEKLAMLDRIENDNKDPGSVPEYEGFGGWLKKMSERYEFHRNYGYTTNTGEARAIEQGRLTQAQQSIDVAASYGTREGERRKEQSHLANEAGAEMGQRDVLNKDIKTATEEAAAQTQVDAQVAAMHQASVTKTVAASAQTAAAVEKFTAATVGGFADVHKTFIEHQRQLEEIRRQIQNQGNRSTSF